MEDMPVTPKNVITFDCLDTPVGGLGALRGDVFCAPFGENQDLLQAS